MYRVSFVEVVVLMSWVLWARLPFFKNRISFMSTNFFSGESKPPLEPILYLSLEFLEAEAIDCEWYDYDEGWKDHYLVNIVSFIILILYLIFKS